MSPANTRSKNENDKGEITLKDVMKSLKSISEDINEFKFETKTNFNTLTKDIIDIKTSTKSLADRVTHCENNNITLAYEIEMLKQKQWALIKR